MMGGLHAANSTEIPYRAQGVFLYPGTQRGTAGSRAMEHALLAKSDYYITAGSRLRRMIDAMSLSYTEAAVIMGVSKQTLNGYMAGEGPPSAYALFRLCRLKKANFDWVFLGDWTQLPAGLAAKLAPDLGPSPAAELRQDRQDAAHETQGS